MENIGKYRKIAQKYPKNPPKLAIKSPFNLP
jgi:hypothetical protein